MNGLRVEVLGGAFVLERRDGALLLGASRVMTELDARELSVAYARIAAVVEREHRLRAVREAFEREMQELCCCWDEECSRWSVADMLHSLALLDDVVWEANRAANP